MHSCPRSGPDRLAPVAVRSRGDGLTAAAVQRAVGLHDRPGSAADGPSMDWRWTGGWEQSNSDLGRSRQSNPLSVGHALRGSWSSRRAVHRPMDSGPTPQSIGGPCIPVEGPACQPKHSALLTMGHEPSSSLSYCTNDFAHFGCMLTLGRLTSTLRL